MAVQPPSTTVLDALSKLKRPEIQALCKANNLRAIGTTGSLIDSLAAYFESLTATKPETKAHVTPKPISRLRRVLSSRHQDTTSQDATTPSVPAGAALAPLPNGSSLKAKASVESLSVKPGARKPSLRVPSITRSHLGSSTISSTPIVTETGEVATSEELPTISDPSLLSPGSVVTPTQRTVASPTPSNRSLASSIRPGRNLVESTNVKPRPPSATAKGLRKVPSSQSFPTASGLSLSTSTKPSSAPTRRASLTPSVASQARSPIPQHPRPRLSSHATPNGLSHSTSTAPSVIRGMQTEIAELTASLKALEIAQVDQIAALTERIAAQDVALQAQNDLVKTLEQTVREMHELLVSVRQDVLEGCKVDVASCVSQAGILTEAVEDLEKKMGKVERELFEEGGRVVGLVREMGDVDVAMASERDRVSCLDTRIGELEVRMDDVLGESTAPTSASSASFKMRKNSKKLSMSGPGIVRQRKQSVRDSADNSPQDSGELFGRDRRLSRASISASLHTSTSTPLSSAPPTAVAFPPTTKRPPIKIPFSGVSAAKGEFKFPPLPQKVAVPATPTFAEPRSRTISAATASNKRTKTPEPNHMIQASPFAGKTLLRTPPAYADGDGEDDPDPQSPADEDDEDTPEERTMRLDMSAQAGEESSEDERVSPPPPIQPRSVRTSVTKRSGLPTTGRASALPAILVNDQKPETSNSSSLASVLSDGAVSVSISDLDVAGGVTSDDEHGMSTKRRINGIGISAAELHDSLLHQPQPSFGGLTTDDEEFDVDEQLGRDDTIVFGSGIALRR